MYFKNEWKSIILHKNKMRVMRDVGEVKAFPIGTINV